MRHLFCKRLNNFWDDITALKGKQKFALMVASERVIIHIIVKIDYHKRDFAKAYLFTKSDIRHFTDSMLNSVFEDLSKIVRHYGGPGPKKLICSFAFGKKVMNYGWFLNQVIK